VFANVFDALSAKEVYCTLHDSCSGIISLLAIYLNEARQPSSKMKCPHCKRPTSRHATECRYQSSRGHDRVVSTGKGLSRSRIFVRRILFCLAVVLLIISGFYISLLATAESLNAEEHAQVDHAIEVLEKKGFTAEAFYLRNFAVFRGGDNWLNSSIAKENAYAATNFPFAIVTLYPDFFSYTADETERASILLHEVRHLIGDDEKGAYEFVWQNRDSLGWTKERYQSSIVWMEVRKQTREYVPNLFVCGFNEFGDCTE
jgi:hypothetical protein